MNRGHCMVLCVLHSAFWPLSAGFAQDNVPIPPPRSVIGHEVGADYKLARWSKILEYFEKLDSTSQRILCQRIDQTTEGRSYLLCEISSEDNLARREQLQAIQARLADPRRIEDGREREEIIANARTTIVVSCGLHSNEVAASQMSMELAYDLVTGNDPRTREILDECIILLVPCANPDGLDKTAEWYDRYLGTPYEGGRMPWLYQKYAGHDNNRDWFMLNLKETQILTRVLYEQWHPTILYDIHQMGNRGPRFFVPPFFDPVNPNVDPLIHQSLLIIGGHMATELQEQGKTGVVFKAIYDNWWQGGNRTTPYRHNIVGILTEAASANRASPVFQEYHELRGGYRGLPQYAPAVNFPEPWPGGWWRLRDVVDYQIISCRALFTLAARYRDRFVRNHLTLSEQQIRKGRVEPPFAWIVPPDQRDPGATAHMLEVLRKTGIEVHKTEQAFLADGTRYPEGTFVLLAEQPFRPHLNDMMQRQDYPERRLYPGGPAEPPYDAAGWTLPLQMGVKSIEVVSPFDTPLSPLKKVEAGRVLPKTEGAQAYITRRWGNHDYAAVNALLEEGFDLDVLTQKHGTYPPGSIVVHADAERADTLAHHLSALCEQMPARFEPLTELPDLPQLQSLNYPKTALYQPWTASMDEGWTRFVLEQFAFAYTTIHNADIRAGDLFRRFDCVILPSQSLRRLLNGVSDKSMPPPYAGGIGPDGAIELERFVEEGGTLVLINSATQLATDVMRVPVWNVLEDLSRDRFFCPGSLLRVHVDNSHPLGYGLPTEVAGYFARSSGFELGEVALKLRSKKEDEDDSEQTSVELTAEEIKSKLEAQPSTAVARYSDSVLLLSGWILGEHYLRNRVAVCEVKSGKGQIVLLGFRIQHRGQPHGTFKFLFNAIYRSAMDSEK